MAIDLIQRAADRLGGKPGRSLVEKAAAKLAEQRAEAPATDIVPSAAVPAANEPLDAEAGRNTRLLALDFTKLQLAGFVTPSGTRTRIAEEYRVIKRPLLLKALATGEEAIDHGNMIMVTSANPGEGKTFTAVNLALSIASERDLHVLLVDADVQRPNIFKTLGVAEEKGLLDVLSGETGDIGDVLIRTNIRNLSLISAGTPALATTELLASQKMANLMEDMARRYPDRIIIFDAPPVLASSEPSVLALHVGQVVVVVEAGRTGQRALEETLNHISVCPNISLVLNKAEVQNRSDRFGAYSYYDVDRAASAAGAR
jgi:receptor protein-tyrosine kinase